MSDALEQLALADVRRLQADLDQARADLAKAVDERESYRRIAEDATGDGNAARGEALRLRAELEATQARLAELETLAQGASGLNATVDRTTALIAERDRLRAVLDALGLVIDEVNDAGEVDTNWAAVGEAYQRARAGTETTPAVAVTCAVCHRPKAPRGRDVAPAAAGGMCTWECPGYDQEPRAGDRWPGEKEPTA